MEIHSNDHRCRLGGNFDDADGHPRVLEEHAI